MSETKKSKKKKQVKQKINIYDFQKQAGGPRQDKNALPSAPGGEAAPERGGRYGSRGGRSGGSRYDDRPKSAADSSRQWRSGGGSRGNRSGGGFGSGDRDRGSRYGSDRGGDRDRGDRQPESRYEESVSRSMFGSKKQSSMTRITSSFGSSRDSFGSSRGSSRMNRDGGSSRMNRDDDVSIDRSAFGKKTPLRPVSNRNFGSSDRRPNSRFEPSSGGYGTGPSRTIQKRGFFDGSGSGFGAHLVADLFTTDSSASSDGGPDRRVNYAFDTPKKTGSSRFQRGGDEPAPARDRAAPWGKATSTTPQNMKTPEQIEEEEREKAEREDAARADRQTREDRQRKKRETREAEERRKAAEKAAREEHEAHLVSLREDVDAMLSGDARPLTREHLEVVMPQIEPSGDEAVILGTALAMTVNQETVPLAEAIHMIPATSFDTTFINMLSSLATRMGEMSFVAEIQAQEIDVFELMQDQNNLEKRLLDANLRCLCGNDETQSQLDQAFSNHVSLKELCNLVATIEDFPAEMIPKITSYIFEEYFTNQNVEDPAAWFASGDIFDFLGEKLNGHTEIIDAAIRSWFANGSNAAALVPMFDRLLRAEYIYADQVSIWSADYENHQAKMTAMMAEIDEEERTFSEWMMDAETEYVFEEEEEEEDDMGGYMI